MTVLRGAQIINILRKKIQDQSYSSFDELNEAQRYIAMRTSFTWLRKRSVTTNAIIPGVNKYSLNLANVRTFTALWIAPSQTETSISITAITLTGTDPVKITTNIAHELETGRQITPVNIEGTIELNNNTYTITKVSDTEFTLDGTNSSLFTAYISGGEISAWAEELDNWELMTESTAKTFEEKIQDNGIDDTWHYYLESEKAPVYDIYIAPAASENMSIRVDYIKRVTDIQQDEYPDIPPEYVDSLINIAAGAILERSEKEMDQIKASKLTARGMSIFEPLFIDSQPNRMISIDRPSQSWMS